MADVNRDALVEWPRKRQRTKGPADTEVVSGVMSDPVRRATRACDQCRAQKKRCDSGRPCRTCTKASLDCHYGKQGRKRGFPTGYVRIIEALWAVVFRSVPGSQEAALHLLRQSHVGYDDEGKATLLNSDFDAAGSSRKAWLSSSIRHEIDKLAAALDDREKAGLMPDRGTSGSGPTVRASTFSQSDFAPWTLPENALRGKPGCRYNGAALERSSTDSCHEPAVLQNSPIELPVPLPSDAWNLIEMYFKFYHSWLPIIPKYSIVRLLTESQDGTKCDASQLGVLWAIFALSCAQRPCHNGDRSPLSDKYYDEAMKTVPNGSTSMEAGHIQGLVLLTVSNMARGHWETASLVLRRSVHAILQLQRSHQNQHKSDAMESVLNRTILAAFAMDTLLAARSGTIPQLRTHDISWALQYNKNEADEWEQWSAITVVQTSNNGHTNSQRPLRVLSTFKQYIKLLSILNESLCDLRPLEDYQAKLDDHQFKLSFWQAQLPKHCQYPTTMTALNGLDVLPTVVNLHITAEAVSRFLFMWRDMSTDKVPQSSTSDESIPVSVYKRAYQEAFGPAAWRGILDLHEYAFHLEEHSNQTKMFTSDRDGRFDKGGFEMLHSESARNSRRSDDPVLQHPVDEGPSVDRLDDIMMEQIPCATPFDLSRFQAMDDTSGADMTLGSFGISHHATSAGNTNVHGQVYSDPGDETSIEALLEELSAQQTVSWDEMEAQCMYNLGFMPADQAMH